MINRVSQDAARDYIANLAPFNASSLWGREQKYFKSMFQNRRLADPINGMELDRMSTSDWLTLRAYLNAGSVKYMVMSYKTPIAYYTDCDGWVFCEKKHSRTTSKHTTIVRRATS